MFSCYLTITGIIPTHLVPTPPRDQGPYTSPGQTLVSPSQLVPTLPKVITPARDRQRSVSGQLVPPCTGGPAHQGPERQPGTDKGQSRSTGPHSTQGPYTRPGQTMVSPRTTGPPLYRRTSPSGGRTPARGRQRSVPGQLVPPTTEWSAHQDSQ